MGLRTIFSKWIRGVATATILGRATAGTGRAEQLTGEQVRTICSVYSTSEVDAIAAAKVTGPATATDNAVARFDATTGKIVQNSAVTIGDDGVITSTGNMVIDPSGLVTLRSVQVGFITTTQGAARGLLNGASTKTYLGSSVTQDVILGANSRADVTINGTNGFVTTACAVSIASGWFLQTETIRALSSAIAFRNYNNTADAALTFGTANVLGKLKVNGTGGSGQNSGEMSFGTSENQSFGATATGAGSVGFYWTDRNADSATSIGGSYNAINFVTAGAKIWQWKAASVEKAYIDVSGGAMFSGTVNATNGIVRLDSRLTGSGTLLSNASDSINVQLNSSISKFCFHNGKSRLIANKDNGFGWCSSADMVAAGHTVDLGIDRASSGVMEINNGTVGTLRDLSCRSIVATSGVSAGPVTFSVLNATTATSTLGVYRITDRGNKLAYPDGTNWRFVVDDAIIS